MSLVMRASKFSGGQPILMGGPGMPVAGTTTYGGSGFERFRGPMAYGRGAMAGDRGMYAGDPGLFGFLGKVVKTGLGVVSKLGIPIASGIAGTVAGFIPGGPGLPGPVTPTVSRFTGTMPISLQTAGQVPARGFRAAVQRAIPGGETGMAMCTTGTRVNKSGYWLQSGQYIEPGTVCVAKRRMNPLNPRALSRAMRRIESAKRATSVLSRISIRKKC